MAEALERAYYDLVCRLKAKNLRLKIALVVSGCLVLLLLVLLIQQRKSK